jgi:hypothetical protein
MSFQNKPRLTEKILVHLIKNLQTYTYIGFYYYDVFLYRVQV